MNKKVFKKKHTLQEIKEEASCNERRKRNKNGPHKEKLEVENMSLI